MSARRVRVPGRQSYGRPVPLGRPTRRAMKLPNLGLVPRRLLIMTAGIAVAGFGLWQVFSINAVTVSAPGRGEEIKREALKQIEASWRQKNLLTFDNEAMVSKLQQADPLLRSVEVRRKWPRGIVVTASLKQPSLGWSTGNQKYLLDRDGTVIGALSADSKLPVVTDGSNLPVQIGARVASARFVAFATELVPALAKVGIGAQGLAVTDTTLDLVVSTNKGYRLIFDTAREVEEEIADLKSVQALLATQNKVPAEYIDLRIAGKAYYK
jgi:cell division septal protein FtsQ